MAVDHGREEGKLLRPDKPADTQAFAQDDEAFCTSLQGLPTPVTCVRLCVESGGESESLGM